MKSTPGPWTSLVFDNSIFVYGVGNSNGEEICEMIDGDRKPTPA